MTINWDMWKDGTTEIQTRGGRKVVIYCIDAPGTYPVHGRIEGNSQCQSWTLDGRPLETMSCSSEIDLVQVMVMINVFIAFRRKDLYNLIYGNKEQIRSLPAGLFRHKHDAINLNTIVQPTNPFCVQEIQLPIVRKI